MMPVSSYWKAAISTVTSIGISKKSGLQTTLEKFRADNLKAPEEKKGKKQVQRLVFMVRGTASISSTPFLYPIVAPAGFSFRMRVTYPAEQNKCNTGQNPAILYKRPVPVVRILPVAHWSIYRRLQCFQRVRLL